MTARDAVRVVLVQGETRHPILVQGETRHPIRDPPPGPIHSNLGTLDPTHCLPLAPGSDMLSSGRLYLALHSTQPCPPTSSMAFGRGKMLLGCSFWLLQPFSPKVTIVSRKDVTSSLNALSLWMRVSTLIRHIYPTEVHPSFCPLFWPNPQIGCIPCLVWTRPGLQ